MMYGQMTAGSWIYIGSQGIVQGTYETFVEMGRQHYGGNLAGKLDPDRGPRRHGRRAAARGDHGGRLDARDRMPTRPHREAPRHALSRRSARRRSTRRSRSSRAPAREGKAISVGLLGNAAEVLPELLRRGVRPDAVTDQTSAHDPVQRLPAGGLDASSSGTAAQQRSRARSRARRARRWRSTCEAMLDVPEARHPGLRLRQQHPPGRARRGRQGRLRFPGLRAGVHPPALLPRHRPVPLGRALRRSRGHLPHRRRR